MAAVMDERSTSRNRRERASMEGVGEGRSAGRNRRERASMEGVREGSRAGRNKCIEAWLRETCPRPAVYSYLAT